MLFLLAMVYNYCSALVRCVPKQIERGEEDKNNKKKIQRRKKKHAALQPTKVLQATHWCILGLFESPVQRCRHHGHTETSA